MVRFKSMLDIVVGEKVGHFGLVYSFLQYRERLGNLRQRKYNCISFNI
jgi:hypothetical protein